MSDMQSDLNKYAKIWDDALQKGIFNDAPKQNLDAEKTQDTDFFGQYLTPEYDKEKPLNEVDTKYWDLVSRKADPLFVESREKESKLSTDAIANAHNPIAPNTVGKDQDVNVTQNWAIGGEQIQQLEKLKIELHDLESKLNTILSKEEEEPKSFQSKIDSLKKEIDKLSDSLGGGRFSSPNSNSAG